MYTTSVKKTNLNTTALRRSWWVLVLLPLRCYRRPLCTPHVVGWVREGVSWMAIVSSDRRLAGQCRYLWSSRSTRDGPPSSRLFLRLYRRCRRQRLGCTMCQVVEVLHHRVAAAPVLMGGAPIGCVPSISSAVSRNKSSN
jgi:hypothetical protein